jgi:dihydrofolate synthase / folylpolyglutamate synthase
VNYNEAISYIENTDKFGINLGLQRVQRLCELMGNPEKDLKIIHVGGTNGKGSTTTFISEILMAEGHKVGIYTSPYIERFTERIKINHREIAEDEVARLVNESRPLIDRLVEEGLEHPTEFEIITACAFKYFKEQKVDFVVLEVGLGGRFDATNIITPLLSVITTISYDHTNILGDTLEKIAFEKAGIIKTDVPLVLYPQDKEALDVILRVAEEKDSRVHFVEDMKYDIISDTVEGIEFNVHGGAEYRGLKIRMLGEHQVRNALTALTAIQALEGIGDSSVKDGLLKATWPGRFELIKKKPYIVLDGGHNLQGIEVLVKSVKRYFAGKKINVVTGMLGDKDYVNMMKGLCEIASSFITVEPNSPRALSSEELKHVAEELGKKAQAAKDIEEAVEMGISITGEEDVLIFCGSLYMIGSVRSILLK